MNRKHDNHCNLKFKTRLHIPIEIDIFSESNIRLGLGNYDKTTTLVYEQLHPTTVDAGTQ